MDIKIIQELRRKYAFPDLYEATEDGLLAVGGDLSAERLLAAYSKGIFPWFGEDDPILWWSPDPRFVLFPDELKVSKSMRQFMRNTNLKVSFDTSFEAVIRSCKTIKRKHESGTWISDDIVYAYTELHKMQIAHSVEVWQEKKLVGGLYGVALGKVFFGESMFSRVSNASKYAFIKLIELLMRKNFYVVDCQVYTSHLESLGARMIEREDFVEYIENGMKFDVLPESWEL